MTSLDDELLPEVLSIIQEVGKSFVFTDNNPVFTEGTGSVSNTPVQYTQLCSPPFNYQKSYIDRDLIKVGDTYIIVPALGLAFTPKQGLVVTFDGSTWLVMAVSPYYTGELIGAYELQLRS